MTVKSMKKFLVKVSKDFCQTKNHQQYQEHLQRYLKHVTKIHVHLLHIPNFVIHILLHIHDLNQVPHLYHSHHVPNLHHTSNVCPKKEIQQNQNFVCIAQLKKDQSGIISSSVFCVVYHRMVTNHVHM